MNSLRSIRILPVFLVFLFAAATPRGVAPVCAQGTAQAIVSGIPPILQSPFVVDFEQDYQQRRFQMQFIYTGQQPASFRFVASLTKEGQQLFSVTSEPTYFEPGTYLYTHLSDNPSISFSEGFDDLVDQLSGRIKRQVIESGAFPEGFYTLRIEPVAADASTFVTGVPGTATFTVMYPEPPRLLSVADQSNLNTLHPSFAWTPVIAPPGTTVDYDVLITEVLASQTPLQALLGNRAHAQVDITGQTTFAYIANQLPLEAGRTYVWQVAATAELAGRVLPLKDDGRSEIWTFTVGAAPGLAAEAPAYVSDGTGDDIDYVNSMTSLSANWAPVSGASSYSYAIGSSSGGTDVLEWTDAGQQTQVTKSGLSFVHGVTYFVSVRATGSDGKDGSATTSDGVVIDTSLPTSTVAVTAVKNTPAEPFVNDASPQVEWSGWDDTSPVTEFEIQFKRDADLSWTTWMAKTDQKSSSFPSNLYGGDGRYRFRSFAWDAAGNKKVFEDHKPIVGQHVPADEIWEAEVVVDTEAPTSKVSPLDPQQSSASFLVSWSGTDVTSGIKSYDIDYQEDNGSWQSWLTAVAGTTTSSEFKGTPGRAYSFRSTAVDSAGNVEAAPQLADASTKSAETSVLSLLAYSLSDTIKVRSYSVSASASGSGEVQIGLTLSGPSGTVAKVDSVELTWFDDTGAQFATEKKELDSAIILRPGETRQVGLSARFTPYVAQPGEKQATHFLDARYKGRTTDNAVVSDVVRDITVIESFEPPVAPALSLAWNFVAEMPPPLLISPASRTEDIEYDVEFTGPAGESFRPVTYIYHWYDEDDKTLVQKMTKPIASQLVITHAPGKWHTQAQIAVSQQEFSALLGSDGSGSTMKLRLEMQGEDSKGNQVSATTAKGIEVVFSPSEHLLLLAWNFVVETPPPFVISPADLTQEIEYDVEFKALGNESFIPDTYVYRWYDWQDSEQLQKTTKPIASQLVISHSPGKWHTQADLALDQTEFTSLLGTNPQGSMLKLRLEMRGKDSKGNPVTGITVDAIEVMFSPSEHFLGMEFATIAGESQTIFITPGGLSGNVTFDFDFKAPVGTSFTPDAYVYYWYDEHDTKLLKKLTKSIVGPVEVRSPGTWQESNLLTLTKSDFNDLLASDPIARILNLRVELRGSDNNNNPVSGITPKASKVMLSATEHQLTMEFNVSDLEGPHFFISPGDLTENVKYDMELEAPIGTSFTPDVYVYHWYNEPGTKLVRKITKPIVGPVEVRSPGSWSQSALLELTKSDITDLVGSGAAAYENLKLFVELQGTDDKSNPVIGITTASVEVAVSAVEHMLSVDYASSSTGPLYFTSAEFLQGADVAKDIKLDVEFKGEVGTTFEADAYVYHWYDENDSTPVHKTTNSIVGPVEVHSPGLWQEPAQVIVSYGDFVAIAGSQTMKRKLRLELRGVDGNGNPVAGITATAIDAIVSQGSVAQLTVQATPDEYVFDEQNLERTWNLQISYASDISFKLDSVTTVYYPSSGSSPLSGESVRDFETLSFKGGNGSHVEPITVEIDDAQRTLLLNPSSAQNFSTAAGPDYRSIDYRIRFVLTGRDSLNNKIWVQSDFVDMILREKTYPLTVVAEPSSTKASDSPVDFGITVSSNVDSDVTLSNLRIHLKKGAAYVPPYGLEHLYVAGQEAATAHEQVGKGLSAVISAKGIWTDSVSIDLNTSYLLDGQDKALCSAQLVYEGKDAAGKDVVGQVFIPIEVKKPGQIDDTDTLVAEAGHYELIPNVASVQALKGVTVVTTDAGNRVLNGVVRLILGPSPFDSTKIGADATNLTFAPVQGKPGHWTVKSGSLLEEGTQLKPDLFRIYKDVVRINKISYQHSRSNPMLIDKAEARIPVLEKTIYLTNLVIDKNGLQMKTAEAEVSAFGLTFRITDIQHKSTSTGSDLALTTGLRLAGKSKSDEFAVTTLKITNTGGKETVAMTAKPGNPIRLIGQTDYLNLKAFSFKKTPTDDVVMSVEVESQGLPLVSKVGPLTGFIEYEKSGKARGRLDFIKETTPGTPANDTSVLEIGKLAKIDVTYVGVQIANKQVTTMNGGVAETTFELDESQSYVGLAADLYLPFMDGQNDRISIGTVTSTSVNPGIQVDFNATVTTKTVTVAKNAKLDLGPLFLELQSLSFKAYPFHMGFSGGIGVDAPGIVEGKLSVTGLTVDQDGNFSNFATAVDKGGQLTILKAVGVGFKDFSYSNTPAPLPYQDGVASSAKDGPEKVVKDLSVNVDSYFQLEGASLTLTTVSGGFDRLLVYEKNGNTSFILKGANVNVKNQVDLNVDFSYINDGNTDALSAGGKAKIANKYSAGVYGALGTRSGESYWGFYVGVAGLQIPVGPGINLEEIGGGFFWNPTLSDIDKVKNKAGFKDPKLSSHIAAMKPTPTSPLTFAAFLNGGVSIGANEVFKGRGLLTITGNSAKLNVEAEVLAATVKGNGYLEISWNPAYVEGNFKVIVDVPLLDCEDKLEFYAYSDQLWGVTGKVQVGVLSFVTTTAEFYAGNDGFMFDLIVKKGIDIFVISGGIELEVMAWWRKDVSWGAYAAGRAYGDLLAGLIGGEVGLEGAFIGSPEFVIFVAGHLKVEILWTDVFNGRVWVSMGENGFDSGTGSGKYDKIIADARNTGKQMKSSMEQLAKDLQNAQNSLLTLSSQELAAAGNALVQNLENPLGRPLLMAEYEKDRDSVIPTARGSFNSAFGVIWNSQSPAFWNRKVSLNSKKSDIDGLLGQLKTDEASLRSALLKAQDLLTGELPTVQEIGSYGNPVSQADYVTVPVVDSTGATKMKTVKAGYQFDVQKAKSLNSGVKQEMADAKAYRQKLVQMAQEFGSKMKGVDQLLSGTGTSVNKVVGDYAYASQLIGSHTTDRLDYFDDRLKHYTKLWFDLSALETQLVADITKDLIALTTDKKKKTLQRNTLQNKLLSLAGLPPKDLKATDPNWTVLAATAGHQIWYKIPMAGFESVSTGSAQARQKFVAGFQNTNNKFQADWSLATLSADKVHARKAKLYTLLYDLFDQLSIEAGTRKETPATTGNMVIGILALDDQGSGSQSTQTAQLGGGGAVAGLQPAAPPTGGLVAASDWTKGWDFEKERLNIKKLLQVPQITSFSGQVVSDKPSGYAKLTLSWNASHPMGVAEYSLDIPKYSIPVKYTPPTSTDPVQVTGIIALQPPSGTQQPPTGAAMIPGTWTPMGSLVQDVVGMQAGTSPTTSAPPTQAPVQPPLAEPGGPQPVPITGGQVTSGPSTTHAWRSMASRTSSTIPFLLGVHEPGTYEVWLRARGEGGLAVQRLATINIQYAFAGSADGQDFGAQKKSDVLASADDTAPTTPLVDDGGAKTDSRTLLFVTWSSTDYESGIQEYQYRVVSTASGQTTPVTAWLSAGGQSEVNIRLDQPMQPALIYYVEVKARNGAGAWSATGSSDGIQLSDPTPPSTPGSIVPQVEKDTLRVAWKPSRDPESKVMGYRYAIGSRPDNTNMLNWTYTQQPGFEVDLRTLSELPEKGKSATIYVSVCAVNGIGVDSPIATAQASVALQTKL